MHHEPAASGLAQMLRGRTEAQAVATGILQPYLLTLLADAYARNGQIKQGLRVLAETMKLAEEKGECWADAEVLRVKGELLRALAVDNDREAERCFRNAIAIVRRQQAKSWELRDNESRSSWATARQAEGSSPSFIGDLRLVHRLLEALA